MGEKPKSRKGKKNPDLYFFLNGQAHKKLQVNHAADILVAWNYEEAKRVAYVLSVARKNMEKAFFTAQVEKMVGRTRMSMINYIKNGLIKRPYLTYSLDGQGKAGLYLWTQQDVLDLHEMMLNHGPGRPRNDGQPVRTNLPSRAELLAMMRNEVVLYTKTRDGEFTPVWQAKDW
ncbi:hypothetical protein SEA_WOFFORD_73 [Streptomyces phage Wofford]|uniref:Helix-turn-helix DNA binding domain protein n=1 Tax=Streptomyces phage Wofford TaxID=2283267 RepID=A0A345MAA1_9CAUD|nr:hypothetical protein HWB78_gp201 [Streptomyces phage Wollford]AXH67422.1 hypothetical protein SEA_WOFFORD_73 [Streptomyces phage Wollford]